MASKGIWPGPAEYDVVVPAIACAQCPTSMLQETPFKLHVVEGFVPTDEKG